MSYRIAYGGNLQVFRSSSRHKRTKLNKVLLVMIVSVVLVCVLCSSKVRSLLIPGDKQVTEAAFCQLADDLKNGEPLYDSVVVFCREILDHA